MLSNQDNDQSTVVIVPGHRKALLGLGVQRREEEQRARAHTGKSRMRAASSGLHHMELARSGTFTRPSRTASATLGMFCTTQNTKGRGKGERQAQKVVDKV